MTCNTNPRQGTAFGINLYAYLRNIRQGIGLCTNLNACLGSVCLMYSRFYYRKIHLCFECLGLVDAIFFRIFVIISLRSDEFFFI